MTGPGWPPSDGDGESNATARVLATILMRMAPNKRKEARSIIASMIERIRLEEGCLGCRLYQDVLDGQTLMFQEVWADEKRFGNHLRSNEFRNVLLVVEMASEPPEIRFDRIACSTGIASIANAPGRTETPWKKDPFPLADKDAPT